MARSTPAPVDDVAPAPVDDVAAPPVPVAAVVPRWPMGFVIDAVPFFSPIEARPSC